MKLFMNLPRMLPNSWIEEMDGSFVRRLKEDNQIQSIRLDVHRANRKWTE